MKKKTKSPVDEYSMGTKLTILFLIYVFPRLMNFITFLTKYFPFSELWKGHFFHYDNREVAQTLDLLGYGKFLSQKLFILDHVEKDRYFIRYFGKFNGKKKDKSKDLVMERLQKKFGENNTYLDQETNGTFQIRVPNNID